VGRAEKSAPVRRAGVGLQGGRESARARGGPHMPALPLPARRPCRPFIQSMARLLGKLGRLVGSGSGGSGACGRRERGCREGERAREQEGVRIGPPSPLPARRPRRHLIYILIYGSITGQGEEAGGAWVGRKECPRAAGGSGVKEKRERERVLFFFFSFLFFSIPTVIEIGLGAQGRGLAPRSAAGTRMQVMPRTCGGVAVATRPAEGGPDLKRRQLCESLEQRMRRAPSFTLFSFFALA